jgi:4-amino-4-deoxy-L-arabinose transferase-like glycosyltransferase
MPKAVLQRGVFIGIVLGYLLLGVLFATRTPAWQAPDEPAHYNYIRQIAQGNGIPVIMLGDWDNDYLEQLKASGFDEAQLDRLTSIEYEDHQPPLYYALSAPIYAFTNGNLTALRLVSVAWGLLVVLCAYWVARLAYPNQPIVALASMAIVAFLPQHLMIVSSVNNDALAFVLVAYLIGLCLRCVIEGRAPILQIGLVLGLIFITKTTGYFMVAVVVTAVGLMWLNQPQRTFSALLKPLVGIALISAVFALAWWGRNVSVYGFPDFLGLRAHDIVVIGQPRTDALIEQVGMSAYLQQMIQTTFQSYWGQFGWMAAPMIGVFAPNDYLAYQVIQLALALAGVGLVGLWLRPSWRIESHDTNVQNGVRYVLLSVLLWSILVFIYYNTQFVQFQGRYLFTSLIPFAVFVALGWDALSRTVRLKEGAWLITFGLFALSLYLIWRVIPGALS